MLMQLLNYVIAKAYFRAGAAWEKGQSLTAKSAFYLHLNSNIIFILMFGPRTPAMPESVILIRNALDGMKKDIKIPLKLERGNSN